MKPRWWRLRVMNDTRLSMAAKAAIIWIETRDRGWRYGVAEACRALGCETKKWQRTLAEAKAAGYVETVYKRDARGRIRWAEIRLLDGAPEGAKSTPAPKHRKVSNETFRTEGAKCTQTKDSSLLGQEIGGKASALRVISGGRDA